MQDGISSTITARLDSSLTRAPVAGVSPTCAPATFFQSSNDRLGKNAEGFDSHLPFHSADNSREFQQDHG